MSATLDASTDRFSRKSPRPTSGSSTCRKFSRVSGWLRNLIPYFDASSRPASSAVTIVMRSAVSPPTCRRMSGSTPWPMLPKPMKTRRPGKCVCVACSVMMSASPLSWNRGPRMYPKSAAAWRYPLCLLAGYLAIWLALAIHPVFRKDWLLENVIVFVAVPLFAATARRLRFSDFAYTCLFAFFVLHAIGAHFTYSLVPYADWWQALGGGALEGRN